VADAFKVRVSHEVTDIILAPGKEVVEAQDLMSLDKKPFAEMRTEKAGAAGDEYPLHQKFTETNFATFNTFTRPSSLIPS
jgi:hypothetical protein